MGQGNIKATTKGRTMPDKLPDFSPSGRGSSIKPRNRFLSTEYVDDFEHFEGDEDFLAELANCRTEYFPDSSKSIVSENDSPDLAFRYSMNSYRGCAHGCPNCQLRPDELKIRRWKSRFVSSRKSKQSC